MFNLLKNFWTASIKRQLILGIAFVHIVMMSFFIIDLVDKEEDFLHKQHQKKVIGLSKTLANTSKVWVLANDFAGLKEVVESMRFYPSIETILIINNQGQVIAHTNKNFIGSYLSDEKSIKLLNSNTVTQIIYEDKTRVDAASPILRDKQLIGWARIVLNKNEINESMMKIISDGLVYTSIAILLGVLFAYFMATGMSKGIYKIIDAIKQTRHTNETHKANLSRKDEIGDLSREFDSMIDTIQEQLHLINSLIDSTPDLIFFKNYKDKDGEYIGCNTAFSTFLGKPKNEIIGKTDYELFEEDKAKFFRENDKKVLESKIVQKNEEWLTYPDKTTKLHDTLKAPLYDLKGNLTGVLGIARNITEAHEVQQDLDKKNIIIYEQSKLASLGEMIGNIAHQWRQPLSTISTLASGIKLQKEFGLLNEEQMNEELENIILTTKYLSKTIDDFRNFLISSENRKEIFNLDEVLIQVQNLIHPALNDNFIKLILNNDKSVKVFAIQNELIQSILNIINNSKDALKERTGNDKIIMIETKSLEPSKTEITILDNAGGIDESIINRIFEPYFTTKHKSQGTGIGLYMVFQIITKSLNGTIEVSNKNFNYNDKEYVGAQFKIVLPTQGEELSLLA